MTDKFRTVIHPDISGATRSCTNRSSTLITLRVGNEVSVSIARDSLLKSSNTLNRRIFGHPVNYHS
ncbi:MAG: hypothetical protein IPI36_13600 [Chitinophagaceae bacterium]|nr:hypothetical protein [Chitinophagaceae bacterium]